MRPLALLALLLLAVSLPARTPPDHSQPSTGNPFDARPRPVMERLSRGVVAIHQPDGKVFVSWRLLVPSVRPTTEGDDRGEGPGRGIALNIDPRFPGAEMWCAGAGMDGIYNAQGEKFLARRPRGLPCDLGVWWDGDLLRGLLDHNRIVKWNWETGTVDPLLVAHACTSGNGTKATPAVSADLWGDWREEVVWATRDGKELRIYTSTIPTKHRLFTLMHDPQYRVAVAWQNTAYNQPPHPGFALDESLPLPPAPAIDVPR